MAPDFKRRLLDLMATRRVSQAQLAKLSGLSQSAISRYLSGERAPSADALSALSRALGATGSELLGLETGTSALEAVGMLLRDVVPGYSFEERLELARVILQEDMRSDRRRHVA